MRLRGVLICCLLGAVSIAAQEQRPSFIRVHPLLSALDADKDGTISTTELGRGPEALAKADANKDGLVTPDELRPAGFGPPRGEGGPRGETRAPQASDLVKTLMSFDVNGDGKLAKAEVPERMQGLFQRADTDNDGVLTSAELTKLAETQQAGGSEQRGPDGSGRQRGGPEGPGGRGMRMDPVMRALDADQNGSLSAEEVRNSAVALKALDRNQDGSITEDEVRPNFGPPGGEGRGRGEGRPQERRQ